MHPEVHRINPSELFYLGDTSLCQRCNGEVTMPSLQNVTALEWSVVGNAKIPLADSQAKLTDLWNMKILMQSSEKT